jgi:hypothetical protein
MNELIGGSLILIGLLCCFTVAGAVIGVPLLILGAVLAFSRGN